MKVVKAYLDDNPTKPELNGIPVINPRLFMQRQECALILITVKPYSDDYKQIAAKCDAMGYPFMSALEFDILSDIHIPDISAFNGSMGGEANRALQIWSDDVSRDAYRNLVRSRYMIEEAAMRREDPEQQYFLDCIPKKYYRSFLDCGAFDGDTYIRFKKYIDDQYDHYYAVEADPTFYSNLSRQTAGKDPKVELFECVIGESVGKCSFLTSTESGSCPHISSDGSGSEMQMDTIDNICANRPVTFIKMDIEGAEMAALRGGLTVLRKHYPALAISSYHEAPHLWQIPLFIHDLNQGYKLICRQHFWYLTETICYAIPT